jgi:hypothetical protein
MSGHTTNKLISKTTRTPIQYFQDSFFKKILTSQFLAKPVISGCYARSGFSCLDYAQVRWEGEPEYNQPAGCW